MVLHRRRTLAPCCSSAATATKSQAAEEGDCVGVAGMGLSDPDRAPSSSDPLLLLSSELEASDSKTGRGGRGKSKLWSLLSSPRHSGSRRLHSESFRSGERLDTPRRRRAFMLFFFAFFRAASAAVVSGRQTGSSRMLVRRTLDATLLLREMRERRWM
ncbi:hypothetical protein DFH08DRAFT_902377 [Mycena albidolilacea]|uniref:Uncharacterized protein n=1 Tax=Mycena albidolilacea TaxID=1033008 RepID=A0AAD6Z3X5_9AGAR|nr:hypothetical protein DFH08DRAFT_902377 [Mycena albidolilacea]